MKFTQNKKRKEFKIMEKTITSNVRKVAKLKGDKCIMCGEKRIPALRAMEAHHIIGNKKGVTITICQNCHKVYEDNKQYWNDKLLDKERSPCFQMLAYIMHISDFLKMQGELLMTWHEVAEENNLDSEIVVMGKETSVSFLLGLVGELFMAISQIIQNAINSAPINKKAEKIINSIIRDLVGKLKDIMNNAPKAIALLVWLQKRGFGYDK